MNLCLPAEMSSDIIKVCVRCRPMSPRERAFTARSVVEAGHSAGEVSGRKKKRKKNSLGGPAPLLAWLHCDDGLS